MFSLPYFVRLVIISIFGRFSSTSATNSLSGRHLRAIWVIQCCNYLFWNQVFFNLTSESISAALEWQSQRIVGATQGRCRPRLSVQSTEFHVSKHKNLLILFKSLDFYFTSPSSTGTKWSELRRTGWNHRLMVEDSSATYSIKLSLAFSSLPISLQTYSNSLKNLREAKTQNCF